MLGCKDPCALRLWMIVRRQVSPWGGEKAEVAKFIRERGRRVGSWKRGPKGRNITRYIAQFELAETDAKISR